MKYGIIGVRDFEGKIYENKPYVHKTLTSLIPDATEIISGGGKGLECLVADYALHKKIKFRKILPNIQVHGKKDAFLFRNLEILKACDIFIIFWDGKVEAMIKPVSIAVADGKQTIILGLK